MNGGKQLAIPSAGMCGDTILNMSEHSIVSTHQISKGDAGSQRDAERTLLVFPTPAYGSLSFCYPISMMTVSIWSARPAFVTPRAKCVRLAPGAYAYRVINQSK